MISASLRNEVLRAHLSLGDEAPRVIGQSSHAIRTALAGAARVPWILHATGARDGQSGSRSGRTPGPQRPE